MLSYVTLYAFAGIAMTSSSPVMVAARCEVTGYGAGFPSLGGSDDESPDDTCLTRSAESAKIPRVCAAFQAVAECVQQIRSTKLLCRNLGSPAV
jgi:hypothetical protein